MKRMITAILALMLAAGLCLPAFAGDYTQDAILWGESGKVTLYKKASTSGGTVGTFFNGCFVTYDSSKYASADKWIKVSLNGAGMSVEGYARGSDLTDGMVEIAPATFDYREVEKAFPLATIIADNAPLYDGTGKKAAVIGRLPDSLPVYILGESGEYYFLSVAGARTHGYTDKTSVRLTGETGSDEDALPVLETRVVYVSDDPMQSAAPLYNTTVSIQEPYLLRGGKEVEVLGYYGDCALVTARFNEWNRQTGFLDTRFLDPDGDHSLPILYVRTDRPTERLLLRGEYNRDTDYYGKFFAGTPVAALTANEEWTNDEYTYVMIGGTTGYFKNEYLIVMGAAALNSAILTQGDALWKDMYGAEGDPIKEGTTVKLLGSSGNAMCVLTEDGRCGYLPMESLAPKNGGTFKAKVSASSLKMRASADEEGKVMRTLSQNTSVTITLHGDVWSQIEYKGETGYVMTRYLKY